MYASVKTVNNKMGPVILYNKSHSFGVHDVIVDLKKVKKGLTYDPYYLSISKKKLNSYKKSKLLIDEGDVGFFNMNLLQRQLELLCTFQLIFCVHHGQTNCT